LGFWGKNEFPKNCEFLGQKKRQILRVSKDQKFLVAAAGFLR
jgi:hypothetical protein